MALINDAKGLIITGGLGGPACCALLTANFSLVCGCDFRIVVTGGGGYYPHHVVTPYYTPMRAPAQDTCLVLVDIKLNEHHWRKSYVVDKGKGDTIITIINTFNKIKSRIVSTVTSFDHAIRRTWAYFNSSDK
jgi:hypothetical protein